jgi:alkanesulfonate monooxygenase SsuD/methylene tetrahydromethanopterin reductase-like flavin-dependent oxidoreductase (luciferase family)
VLAEKCEAAGVGGLFTSDHYLSEREPTTLGGLDAWAVMAGLASMTQRIRLGTLVTPVTFRHPAVLAKNAVTVDHISRGRVEVGIGAGWYRNEHAAYGFEFPEYEARLMLLEEHLKVIRALTGPGATSYNGLYRLVECPGVPKPVQERLPIIVGGIGRRGTLECAARHADEYNLHDVSIERCRSVRAQLDEACLSIGRDPAGLSLSLTLTCVIGADGTEVKRRLRPALALRATSETPAWPKVDDGWLIGTPDELVDQLSDLSEAHVRRVFLSFADHEDMDAIQLLGGEVVPRLLLS